VNASFAARGWSPLEMLDRIRDVNFGAVDPGFIEGGVKNLPCGAHERPPFYVFPITGLLSDEYYFSTLGTLSEDGLGGVFPQIACLAGLRFRTQLSQRVFFVSGFGGRFRLAYRRLITPL